MSEGTLSVLGPGGYSKAPYGSFAGKPMQLVFPKTVGDLGQLDRGLPYQSVQVYLGPTLGWVQEFVRPEIVYTSPLINLGPKDSVVILNVASAATVNLPDVNAWMREPFYSLYTPFERAIWVKDISGNAGMNTISIFPFGSQKIDGASSFSIAINHGIARLYPRNDLGGWYVG